MLREKCDDASDEFAAKSAATLNPSPMLDTINCRLGGGVIKLGLLKFLVYLSKLNYNLFGTRDVAVR